MEKLTKKTFVKALKGMSLLEIKELVDGLKEEFGIDPTVVTAAPVADKADAGPTEISIIITSDGGQKINVIKAVREITGVGLMDAKKAVESLPYTIKEGILPAEGEEIIAKLKAAGATIEIK